MLGYYLRFVYVMIFVWVLFSCLCGKFGDYIIDCVRLILDRWRNIFIRIEDMKNEKGKSEKDRLVKYY